LDNSGEVIITSAEGDDIVISEFHFMDFDGATIHTADFTTMDANEQIPATATPLANVLGNGTSSVVAQGQVTFHSNHPYSIDVTGATVEHTNWFAQAANASSLENVADIDISTRIGAGNALKVVDSAIAYIDEQRAALGAVMNRFESTIANLNNVAENLSAARSRILDADIAQETSSMTKQNILQQAGVAILAQANMTPQLALQLLQG
ncbi:MAG: flagellin, partial [Desulfofustis sp.]|nr:flagellin [Desulfofustis sp.]